MGDWNSYFLKTVSGHFSLADNSVRQEDNTWQSSYYAGNRRSAVHALHTRHLQLLSQPRRAASIAAISIFFIDIIAPKARFASAPTSRKRIAQRAWSDLPGEAPTVLAPTARAFLAAIADDRSPVAVRLCLVFRCNLE